jgi:1-acyl-sn-glycerol-3-phosphate acyltransferase
MIDTNIAQPIGRKVPNRHQTGVKIGKPLFFHEYQGRQEDREALREVTDTIMRAIQRLSGQEYVDRDAAQVKKELDRAARGEYPGEMGE